MNLENIKKDKPGKEVTKESLLEDLDFLKQLAEKTIPYSCFGYLQAVQNAYEQLSKCIKESNYKDK